MHHLKKILFGFVGVALLSCDTSTEKPIDRGEDYIPVQKGWFQIYDVDEIIFTLNVPETLKYELKTLVADSFANVEGGFTYVIQRAKRNYDDTGWQNEATWSVRINHGEAVVQEENIPYVVLRFPITQGMEWDGNRYNNQINPGTNEHDDFYRLEKKGEPFTVNGTTFNDCVLINQEDNEEFIVYFDKRTEVYGRGIGLIYKEKIQLQYCTETHCIGQQKVENGVIFKQMIKEYGRE